MYTVYVGIHMYGLPRGLLRGCSGKESTCQCRRHGFDSWVRKIPWSWKWQPTPVFLAREFHGLNCLENSSWATTHEMRSRKSWT